MYRNWFASLLFAVSLPLAACQGTGGTGSATLAVQGQGCQVSSQCLPGLECEVEHGVGTCQPHGHKGNADAGKVEDDHDGGDDKGDGGVGGACQVDADCAKGEECEVEHGVGSCKPHEGDDDGVDGGEHEGGDDKGQDGGEDGDDNGGGGGGGGGNEGHGNGGVDGGVSCKVDADCAKGQRCKVEHNVGLCEDHG